MFIKFKSFFPRLISDLNSKIAEKELLSWVLNCGSEQLIQHGIHLITTDNVTRQELEIGISICHHDKSNDIVRMPSDAFVRKDK